MGANAKQAKQAKANNNNKTPKKPNFLILYVDDQGYSDLSIMGHPTILTPNIDKLALESLRFTQFYSGAPLCSPSRAALLTGRYPIRSGCAGGEWKGSYGSNADFVFSTTSIGGLPRNETTFASILKANGYYTKMIGKWHLGVLDEYMPYNHGFDDYYGIPYSVDMGSSSLNINGYVPGEITPLPFMHNDKIIAQPANLNNLTNSYTTHAIEFIKNQKEPWLLYLSYNHVHMPQFYNNQNFFNKSKRGDFGDASMELDHSIGQIFNFIKAHPNIDENTIIIYTSDNGAQTNNLNGGSAGLFYGGKGETFEGGIRVPAFIRWLGKDGLKNPIIKPGITQEIAHTVDIFTTMLSFANIALPKDRIIDGKDLTSLLLGKTNKSPHECIPIYMGQSNPLNKTETGLWAMRCNQYKAHFIVGDRYNRSPIKFYPKHRPLLYNIEHDPSEKFPLNMSDPININIANYIINKANEHYATVDINIPNQMAKGNNPNNIICCDYNSQIKYPNLPQCTCTPQNFNRNQTLQVVGVSQ